MHKAAWRLTLALSVSVFLLGALVVLRFDSLPISQSAIDELHVGMPADQVRSLIGEPTGVRDNGAEWVYSSNLSWPIVTLAFSDHEKLERIVIDR